MDRMIKSFFDFSNQKYLLFAIKGKMKDNRKSPQSQISPSVIFLSLLMLVLFNKGSLLKLDQMMRLKPVKNFFKVGSQRKMAVSDSTISRSLSGFEIEPLRSYLKLIYLKAKEEGKCKVELFGRKLKIASVDGSQFGVFYGCALQILGEANLLLDIEVAKGRGKEIAATNSLLQRAFEQYKGSYKDSNKDSLAFAELVLLDGLYANQNTINLILKHKSNALIKTDEERLNIIKDAKGLFSHWQNYSGIEHEVGFDDQRLCEYELWACEGFSFGGVNTPMKVAHVKEKYPKEVKKKKQNRDFWVLCTDETLTGRQLRELAHLRWRIENNGFRQLNQQASCDHVYTHEVHAFEALMLILFIGCNR